MFYRRLIQLASVGLCLAVSARAEENVWPLFVSRSSPTAEEVVSEQYLGPLFFHRSDGVRDASGFRPLFLTQRTGDKVETDILYPFFMWKRQPGYSSFSFFHLLEHRTNEGAEAPTDQTFNVWPFYFSRKSDDPAKSYEALFPLGGTTKNRLGRERIHFVLFPFYLETLKAGRTVKHTPWPFIRNYTGPGYAGFEFWPFYGRNTHVGDYDHRFFLWPLVNYSADHLSAPVPDERLAVLPFYSRLTGPGYVSETYLWPFFGYTHRTQPDTYDEQRYFWPFLVQGRGSERRVNRWAPFYSHTVTKSQEKTWMLWPLHRHLRWRDASLQHDKTQFLYFLYWSLEQHSLTNPSAAPAYKRHLWPLLTAWDNGAGREQVQVLSPFEPLFQHNAKIRQLWTPLFALYQYDRQPDGSERHAYLWNAITWRRSPDSREFHLGPLFDLRGGTEGKRWSVGCGLFGGQRTATGRWRPFLFDFRMKAANKAASAKSP
jgi:hypothetical protein